MQGLNDSLKEQTKEKEEIILKLTKEDHAAMKQMIELESKIGVLEKKNEKTANETVNVYEEKIKKKD